MLLQEAVLLTPNYFCVVSTDLYGFKKPHKSHSKEEQWVHAVLEDLPTLSQHRQTEQFGAFHLQNSPCHSAYFCIVYSWQQASGCKT